MTSPRRRTALRPARALPLIVGSVVVITLVTGGILMARNGGISAGAKADGSPRGTLDLATASIMNFDISTTCSGELEARNQIEIRNKLDRVTTIQDIVAEGTRVKAGTELVRLNSEEFQKQVDENTLVVESAKADLASAENAYEIQVSENESLLRKAILVKDLAELDVRKWLEGEVVSKRQVNDLALDKARREHERLKEKFDQAVLLESKGFLSKDELKRDELAYLEAVAAVQTAELGKKTYEDFEHPKDKKTRESAVEDAIAELERTRSKNANQLTTREAERLNKRQQLALRQNRLDELKDQVAAAILVAPSDGLVVHATSMNRDMRGGDEGPLQIGRQVYSNQLLIVLPDTSEMVASVRVQESLAGKVRAGLPATIKIDALGGRSFGGKVLSVGVLAENGGWRDPNLREYTVKILLDLPPVGPDRPDVKPSMRCEAEIILDSVEKALAVPLQGIFSEGLVRYVHVADSAGKFVRKPVRLGRRSDRFAEIKTGINEGDSVLVRKPTPSEVLDKPWNQAQLAAVGLDLSPDGKIIPLGGAGPGGGGGGDKPGRVGNRAAAAKPAAAKPDAAKPDAAKPAAPKSAPIAAANDLPSPAATPAPAPSGPGAPPSSPAPAATPAPTNK